MATHGRLQRTTLVIGTVLLVAGVLTPVFAQGNGESTVRVDVRHLTVGTHFFAPEQFMFSAGTHVRFLVTNVSRDHVHDILITPADHVTIVGGRPEILHVGEHVSIDWTPTSSGVYRLICAVCGPDEMVAYLYVT